MPDSPIQAVISDMDGVITQTASIHEAAWKQVFDDLLQAQSNQAPFTSEDYRRHVDGKPRLTGIRDFLAARGLSLPEGSAEDDSAYATVQGLGKRKNEVFLQKLAQLGVRVFDDSLKAFTRWRRQGLKIAVVSASRNCRPILRQAGIEEYFDTIVDGTDLERQGLTDKTGQILEAARRLQVPVAKTALLEDASSGIQAGRRAGVGRLIGVLRVDDPTALQQAGADQVVTDLADAHLMPQPALNP